MPAPIHDDPDLAMFLNRDRLVIFDADGTLIDAFRAIETTFARHDMAIGDLERFQKRRKLLKYLGGLREFPRNLRQQFGKQSRKRLVQTLTEVYREEARLYDGLADLLRMLIAAPDVRVGIVTRNITHEPAETLRRLLARHGIEAAALDFIACIPLKADKLGEFRTLRQRFGINPALGYACGDEQRDYAAAVGAGLNPFIVSYGFEDFQRLRDDDVPAELIAATPQALAERLCHALGLPWPRVTSEQALAG